MVVAMVARLPGSFRAARHAPAQAHPESLRVLANAALKPGNKTWLVARAVSLRAF